MANKPWDGNTMDKQGEQLKKKEQKFYCNKLEKLLSLAGGTRPDISYTVDRLVAAASCPSSTDWTRLLQVLRYLKGTKHYRITYMRPAQQGSLDLHGFVDASFGANLTICQKMSRTGLVIKLANGPVYWRSHLQKSTAKSNNDAEYVALCEAAERTLDIANITHELQFKTKVPKLYEDNTTAISLAAKGWIAKKDLQIEYIPTTQQVADPLTKGGHHELALVKLITTMGLVTDGPQKAKSKKQKTKNKKQKKMKKAVLCSPA